MDDIMVFSTNLFLFVFLPLVLLIYFFIRKHIALKNLFLLASSLFFYACGEPLFVLLMIASIIANYIFGLCMISQKHRRLTVAAAVIYNIGMLFIFKYMNFFAENLGILFNTSFALKKIALPIGISFYTFQALSYVLDIYQGKTKIQKNIFNLGLYISFFPQLIAGPIVRYETIADQILNRQESPELFNEGVRRFIIGLSKKVVLSNNVALLADVAFSNINSNTVAMAWLGAVAYTLQIYFDFSGYSDMAIGLGKIFGFNFNENFNYPYISKSITEFWRRWHISLSTWFRDYVYIPLGGNRVRKSRQVFNMFVVWLCTGFWHGANWTFVVWGIMYFILLFIEKHFLSDKKDSCFKNIFGHFYTMLAVTVGWVIFRAENLTQAFQYLKTMFFLSGNGIADMQILWYLKNFAAILILAILGSIPLKKLISRFEGSKHFSLISKIYMIAIFLITISFMARKGYNPFIYFNF